MKAIDRGNWPADWPEEWRAALATPYNPHEPDCGFYEVVYDDLHRPRLRLNLRGPRANEPLGGPR
jgi:hypothetical protein